MATRLAKAERRSIILKEAESLFLTNGYGLTEMEGIRKACGISRGGLYHHFANKVSILDALIEEEIGELARQLKGEVDPIVFLLRGESVLMGNERGLLDALVSNEDKRTYLSALDQALNKQLMPALENSLTEMIVTGVQAKHVAELFLTVNAHINRRVILDDWTLAEASEFAGTALVALIPFLKSTSNLREVICFLNPSLDKKGDEGVLL